MNITGAVAGNPRLHHLKTAMFLNIFNTPFQKTIVRSHRAAMFVWQVADF